MSVVVWGMEMPKVCITKNDWYGHCPMDRIWCAQRYAPKNYTMGQVFDDQYGKLPDWCPLRPLPKIHDRLIEADKLRSEFPDPNESMGGWRNPDEAVVHKTGVWAAIDCAETIVEAEGK